MADKVFNILIVDDNVKNANHLTQVLQDPDFYLEPAYSGRDALQKLSVKDFDIIVCDIQMPEMSGLELLSHIRHSYDDLAFILMTEEMQQDYLIEAIRLGASDFVRKPVDRIQLLKSIRLQINKRKDVLDYLKVSGCVSQAEIKLDLPPAMFQQVDFIKIFTMFFRQNLNISTKIVNELLLCMEEMLYNAFIHGTMGLKQHERTICYDSYKKLIQHKLQLPEIACKKIHLLLKVDQEQDKIIFEVEDEGEGFDYGLWLERLKTNQGIQLDEYGRGISIIYHLTDKVSFDKNGRFIRIEKKISDAATQARATV